AQTATPIHALRVGKRKRVPLVRALDVNGAEGESGATAGIRLWPKQADCPQCAAKAFRTIRHKASQHAGKPNHNAEERVESRAGVRFAAARQARRHVRSVCFLSRSG